MQLKRKDKVYYAQIMPAIGVFNVCDLIVRTVTDTWFTGVDKRSKHAYLFGNSAINKIVFTDRDMALKTVLEAEKINLKIA